MDKIKSHKRVIDKQKKKREKEREKSGRTIIKKKNQDAEPKNSNQNKEVYESKIKREYRKIIININKKIKQTLAILKSLN